MIPRGRSDRRVRTATFLEGTAAAILSSTERRIRVSGSLVAGPTAKESATERLLSGRMLRDLFKKKET